MVFKNLYFFFYVNTSHLRHKICAVTTRSSIVELCIYKKKVWS